MSIGRLASGESEVLDNHCCQCVVEDVRCGLLGKEDEWHGEEESEENSDYGRELNEQRLIK
jgi:hypothetical protein